MTDQPETNLFPELEVPPAAARELFPEPVADYGPVGLELMGHRYREGHLAEVVVAGQPFLQMVSADHGTELYRPDAVYCITPMTEKALAVPAARPRALPAGVPVWDDDDDMYGDRDDNGDEL